MSNQQKLFAVHATLDRPGITKSVLDINGCGGCRLMRGGGGGGGCERDC